MFRKFYKNGMSRSMDEQINCSTVFEENQYNCPETFADYIVQLSEVLVTFIEDRWLLPNIRVKRFCGSNLLAPVIKDLIKAMALLFVHIIS